METLTEKSTIVYKKPSIGSWILSGLSHRGKTGTYEAIEEMTPSMTQDNLISKYGLQIPSTDLVWAIASRGYELRKESPEASEALRRFLKQGFRQYLNTSTRIVYTSEGSDRIIHNYGTSDEYSIDEQVVGPDEFVHKLPDQKVLESLLGTQDVGRINEVSQWVNGTDNHLWRFNSKPKQREERVARFYAGGYWLYLDCNRNPHGEYPAFRVLKVE